MKIIFLALALVFLHSIGNAQNKITVTDEAKQEFAGLYFRLQPDDDKTMLEKLHMTNDIFFSAFGPNANKYFNPLLKGKSKSEARANFVAYADSLNAWFIQNKFYDSSQQDIERLQEVLPGITDALCSCINKRLQQKDSIPPGTNLTVFSDCNQAFVSDYKLVLKLRLALAGYTTKQMMMASRVVSTYAMMHCKATYLFIKRNNVNVAGEQLLGGSQFFIEELPKTIRRLYMGKKTDSLLKYFPGYQQYTSQLNALTGQKDDWQKRETATNSDTLIFTATYTSGSYGHSRVTGQVKLYLSNDVAPVVYRLDYADRSKIPNVAALEKELNKADLILPPPPPPVEIKH